MDLKKCTRCLSEKPLTEFYLRRWKNADGSIGEGYHGSCRKCADKLAKASRENNPERTKATNKKYYESISGERRLHRAAKARAKSQGVPFGITVSDIVIPDVCPILGIPLYRGKGVKVDNSPSLDKIVPQHGYVPGNIAVISERANRIKNNATADELEAIARWIKNTHE